MKKTMNLQLGFAVILVLVKYSHQCTLNYNDIDCYYQMTCIDTVTTDYGWTYFQRGNNRQYGWNQDYPVSDPCNNAPSVSYAEYNLNRVYLNFRQKSPYMGPDNQIPVIDYNGYNVVNILYSLDLSNNDYDSMPVLREMPNLVVLNMSTNHITTATLSNVNELNLLEQIDFSYNTISAIEVNDYEHPYLALKKIDLSHNYLVKIPDAIFDKFDNLEVLYLGYNYIDGLSQSTFEGMRNLLHLDLSNNRLADTNSALFRFNKLKVLNLSENRISTISLSDFQNLSQLVSLDLKGNSLKIVDASVLINMASLQSLDLSYNNMEEVNKDMFLNLYSLTTINLSNNKLKTLPKGMFKNMTINEFSISDNILQGSLVKGMFDGVNVSKLDLSHQMLTAVEDYAFKDLIELDTLLLSSNQIETLSNFSFKTLVNLQVLDLSHNKIVSIDFNKDDLTKIHKLLVKNNQIAQITNEQLMNLNSLEYLDLSGNVITNISPSSFKLLKSLINLQISNNPLTGILKTGTFDGLSSLPSLDISSNLLTVIQNASFIDMSELRTLNISHSDITELQYNVFLHTGYIETLDLSFNKLEEFNVNLTELIGLTELLLNNNRILALSAASFSGLQHLNTLDLSFNNIELVLNDSFTDQTDLRKFDLSYNKNIKFSIDFMVKMKVLNTLNLSGIQTCIDFNKIGHSLSHLIMSNASITNISEIHLSGLTQVDNLVLSYNNISELKVGAFSGMESLRDLDLSFNRIYSIQPGVFKNNSLLQTLNLSHNALSSIGFGIFRGLIYLNTLDISFNEISELENERFYEVRSLTELIVDHNRINSVTIEEFEGTSLSILSIGENPLPCQMLIKLKRSGASLKVTAINIDEHNGENVDGVTCNRDKSVKTTIQPNIVTNIPASNDVLTDIRNILYNLTYRSSGVVKENYTLITDGIRQILSENNNTKKQNDNIVLEKLSNLPNVSLTVVDLTNNTNMLLQKILNSLSKRPIATTTLEPVIVTTTKSTSTSDINKTLDVILYINKMKQELKHSIEIEKQNIIHELESKFSNISYQNEAPTSPKNEKLVSNADGTKSIFTETCVGLILAILVCLVLYKFYKSRMFVRSRLSYSTRELPGSMDNSNL